MSQDLTTIFTLRAPDKQISTIAIDHFAEVETLDDTTRKAYLKTVKNGLKKKLKDNPDWKSYKVAHVNNNNLLRIPGVKRFPSFEEFIQMIDLGDTTFDSYMLLPQPYEKAIELIFKVPGYEAFPAERFIREDLIVTEEDVVQDQQEEIPVVENSNSDETQPEDVEDTASTPENVDDASEAEASSETIEESQETPIVYKPFKSRTVLTGVVADLFTDNLDKATILAVGGNVMTRKITTEQMREAFNTADQLGYDLSIASFALLPASRNYINQFNAQVDAWLQMAETVTEHTNLEYPILLERRPSQVYTLSDAASNLKLYIM